MHFSFSINVWTCPKITDVSYSIAKLTLFHNTEVSGNASVYYKHASESSIGANGSSKFQRSSQSKRALYAYTDMFNHRIVRGTASY